MILPILGGTYRSANRPVHGPLLGGTIDWGCFRPITTPNQMVIVDFNRRRLLPGGISLGRRKKREKKRENLEIRRRSPSMILIYRRPHKLDVANEMLPPRLRRRGLDVVDDF